LTDWRIALSPGGLPKVDKSYREALQATVEQAPRAVEQPFSTWTCRDLAHYLADCGRTLLSAETVRRHLLDLGYRIVRPVLSIASPDPEYAVKAARLEQLRDQARQGEITLLYEDEVDLNLLPGVIGCWTQRGGQRKVPTPGQNVKRYGFGAVNFMTGQLTHHIGERKNSDNFIQLVEQVVATYCPDPVWQGPKVALVIDNYIIHRSKKTAAVLAKYADRLEVMALPTYSPQLNLIERLWKHLRRKVTHNHLFDCITALVAAVQQFLTDLDGRRSEVLSVIGNPQ
jgi:transposase